MGLSETLGVPSPDECVGVAGVAVSLVGLTVGVALLLLFQGGFLTWALVIASLLVGWVSFMYCVVWGESSPEGDVWEG